MPMQIDMFGSYSAAAHAQAYGRLRGKLYKGNAALGVTAASIQQSRDMIAQRSNLITSAAEELESLSSRKKFTKRMANNHLEVIFGWQPLLQDIYNSAMKVVQLADQYEFVRASGVVQFNDLYKGRNDRQQKAQSRYSGSYRVSMGGQVKVTSPNLWLAERAGLLNPLAVAWDLVPWSHIVNMFTNVGSLVNQISDFSGLTFSESFTARRLDLTTVHHTVYPSRPNQAYELYTVKNVDKDRRVGFSGPPVKLSFRTPELTWSTAAMAASLMVQKAVPMVRLAGKLKRYSNSLPYTG